MLKGPFLIDVPKEAQKVSKEQLRDEEKRVLFHNSPIEPGVDIYRFGIVPVLQLIEDSKVSRKLKRSCYEYTDRCLVHTRVLHESIKILGIFPTTCTSSGQWVLDLTLDGSAALFQEGIGHLKVEGIFKYKVNSRKFLIYAHRHNSLAQWIFLKEWVQEKSDFAVELLCTVPRRITDDRFLLCDVQFQNGGRIVETARHRKIYLPA